MINIQKLESDTYRLKDLESLRNLFADLNFDYEDKPVDKQNWNKEMREIVVDSRIVAKKDNYFIFYIKTNSDTVKDWKKVATRIISDNNGFCLVCSHNPSGFQWIFSSLSKEFSKSFSETRHIPIDIRPNIGIPKPFLEFLQSIKVEDADKAINIVRKISDAFDKFSLQIHDELTVNVFEALKTFSEGILRNGKNKILLSNESLEKLREPIFILLYRIIFVLYAEDRSIFPIENDIYYNKFSIKWVKNNWILNAPYQSKLNEYEIQNRLKNLFRLIEVGSEELGFKPEEFFMMSYYGRLFDSNINSELERWNITNEYYIKAIELLTSTKDKKGNRFFLDYAALQVRHLGSIYEHLLEFHLTVRGKKIADLPSPEDRKSSGSYYTPQYVVDYIVTRSIEPMIDKIIKGCPSKTEQIEKILSLNILDPAMGSGHFLVGATEYIAKRICEIENKLAHQDYVERKRDVVRCCIYGVDINPLAVDLAALSLWLETLSSEKPLSFLSAHLKVGNSLVGSEIKEIFEQQTTFLESQKGRDLFNKNVKEFLMLENLADDTSSAVRTKVEKYEKIQKRGTMYYDLKFLLDAKIARSFGINVPPLGDYRAKIGENSIDFYSYDVGPKIKILSKKNKFFHWELEFPDIFFDEKGTKINSGGFDAIIGNPPYEVLIKSKTDESYLNYLKSGYENPLMMLGEKPRNGYWSAEYNPNLFALFIEKSLSLLKDSGELAFIIQNSLFTNIYFQNIRRLILDNSTLEEILDFRFEVFEEASVDSAIMVMRKEKNPDKRNYNVIKVRLNLEKVEDIMDPKKIVTFDQSFFNDTKIGYRFPIYLDKETFGIIAKMNNIPDRMGSYIQINRGIGLVSPDDRHKMSLFKKSKSSNEDKPVFVGKDITRYITKWSGNWAKINTRTVVGGTRNPEVHEFKEKIIFPRIRNLKYKRRILASYDSKKIWVLDNYNIVRSNNDNLSTKYLLGLLNSTLLNYYFRNFFVDVNIKGDFVEKLPIIIQEDQQPLISLVDDLLKLHEQLIESGNNDNHELNQLRQTIQKVDKQIDDLIYSIYGISDQEIQTIEKDMAQVVAE